ncbi:hypothetical protein B0H11DRAFT_2422910 [Mycena galericulata]|nr:hypothetical protein B0H11DRAFT_2422910 [Mycena galericulata]
MEASLYYAGIPSTPLVAPKRAPPRRKHTLQEVWNGKLAPKIHNVLDTMETLLWTSTNVVHIVNAGESSGPVIVWIGVIPGSLSGTKGVVVAAKCRDLLLEFKVTDVEVEIRESVITRSAGLQSPTLRPTPPFLMDRMKDHGFKADLNPVLRPRQGASAGAGRAGRTG